MVEIVARILFPMSLIIAAALLIKGYTDVGDGFSAGAVAGLGAVIQYVCLDHARAARAVGAGAALLLIALGLLIVVLTLIVIPPLLGHPPVSHLPPPGGHALKFGSLELHTTLVMDLGVALLVYGAFVATFDRLFPAWSGEEPDADGAAEPNGAEL